MNSIKSRLHIKLSAPRGFCAGVDRAIQIVEEALTKWGRPVFVRHEIVHNAHVVKRLEDLGAIFVESLDECPDDRPVIFSAHGVPKSVPKAASARAMTFVDATCPLVSKVHVEAERLAAQDYELILIGHAGHPEVIGTMGQLAAGTISLVETLADVATLSPNTPDKLAFLTQTTLSVDDTADIVAALKTRFPKIRAPYKEDICYATTNRQVAVKEIAEGTQLFLVIGAETSSNSKRLVEVAVKAGCPHARLIASDENIDWAWFEGVKTLGLTAGASAPEDLVQGVISACADRFDISIEEISTAKETVIFKLPRILAQAETAE